MQYGTATTTQILDENGSTEITTEKYVKGIINKPVRKAYEIKTRVKSQAEEHEAYINFSDSLSRDKSKLEPSFKIERSKIGDDNGYYYVVECYSVLEY